MDFAAWMNAQRARANAALLLRLPAAEAAPVRLHQAMRYVCLNGGKRVRPLLTYAAAETCATANAAAVAAELLDRAATSLEFIHVYSLTHDDLPAMDDDTLRRGQPTCHVAFDEATALLVGDALQALAFATLACGAGEPARKLTMLRLLAEAAGSRGMAGGQALDLAYVGQTISQAELEFMHILKTGALIRAAVLLGAHCVDADETQCQHLAHYAHRAGLLFQVVDDILDVSAPTSVLGKTAGKDAAAHKPTYVELLGLQRAQSYAAELEDEAIAALQPFGARAQRLVELTQYIARRNH